MVVTSEFISESIVPTAKFEERIARLMEAAGTKSDSELARALGIQPQSVAAARKRQQIPGGWVEAIAERCNTSADWLLFGTISKGTAFDRRERKSSGAATGSQGHIIPQMEWARDGAAVPTPVVAAQHLETVDSHDCRLAMVPMVEARLSAGTGSFVTGGEEERRYAFRVDFLSRKGSPSSMVLMRVDGDSMEPRISNNDVVLIDQSQTTPRAGGLYAVGVEDLVYIKMVDTLPGRIILKSFNPAYQPLEIDARGDLADGIRIIGRAVWIGRELY
jgi:phage repressor protein C with HTH and peptisase S24 domain